MALLEVSGVSVNFGGLKALDTVSLDVDPGVMVGLIGPNGAGKSTLIGVLSGLQRPVAGSLVFDGRNLVRTAPHRRVQYGMTRTFQRLELWDSMSVFDNVLTASELAARWRKDFDARESANDAVDLLGLRAVASKSISSLSTGTARLVEVARALASRPSLMLLDEPSAGLDKNEAAQLGDVLAGVVASAGTSILLVEHHVDMVFKHCAAVYVLDFGRVIASGPPTHVQNDEAVRTAYLGGFVGAPT
jgi:branched-chain amino acid transport system ATP-binding protein